MEEFLDAAASAVVAANSGLHVMLEGPTGSGLTTLAKFVAYYSTKADTRFTSTPLPDIPQVLLRPESTMENISAAFKPHTLVSDSESITRLVQWENGHLLEASSAAVPVILGRIDETKAQVSERLNPILAKNARRGVTKFLVPAKGELTEIVVEKGLTVIATLTIGARRQTPATSLALRNTFVTVAVESPVMTSALREKISKIVITRLSAKLRTINYSSLSGWARPAQGSASDLQSLVEVISRLTSENGTV
jgi:midasin (ATPase involved in ribosome maturation)